VSNLNELLEDLQGFVLDEAKRSRFKVDPEKSARLKKTMAREARVRGIIKKAVDDLLVVIGEHLTTPHYKAGQKRDLQMPIERFEMAVLRAMRNYTGP